MGVIDREGNRSHRKSKMFISLFLIIVLALSLMTISFLKLQESELDPLESPVPSRIVYTTHATIYIDGNAGFLGSNASTGISWGNGTASDPYIIADWEINASSAHGIEIRDSNVHFIVRNCYVHDGKPQYKGICLRNCVNGILEDNICLDNLHGIYLSLSSSNTLINNNCSNNYEGIVLSDSNSNTLSNSNCSSNWEEGIWLDYSSNNTLINNNCPNNAVGISLDSSSNNTLSDNNCSNNWYGIWFCDSNNNTLSNNICSCYYYLIGIWLCDSSNNTLSNNNCSNNADGIYLDSSNNNILSNNNCSNYMDSIDAHGIYLDSSSNNILSNNTCSNKKNGIYLSLSNSNTLSNNNCSSNKYEGIDLFSSSNNILSGNILNENGILIYGSELFHWNTHDIDVSNKVNGKPVYYYKNQTGITVPDGAGQVFLANCTYFVIENQNLSHASIGINLGFSSNSLFANNSCSNNVYGIWLQKSSSNTMSNNNCSNNIYGILLHSSSNNVLSNNNCSYNSRGIDLFISNNNTIIWNQLCNNIRYGVYIQSDFLTLCYLNMVWNNTFYHNNGARDTYDPSHIQAYDDGTNNRWNSTEGYGNYWSDWTTPDGDMNGIVDNPYNIDGSAGAKDYYPQTTMPLIPEPSVFILVGIMIAIFLIFGVARKKK